MNLIEENFQNKEEKRKKRTTGIILAAIIFVILIIIAISVYLFYIQTTTMRVFLNNQSNESLKQILYFPEGEDKVYIPIKEVAAYLGYESYNGEYTNKTEDKSKCYAQSENEVVNFVLNSNVIYKLDLTNSNNNYENIYVDEPIMAEGGILYATPETIEKAFNVSFQYDKEANKINIYTLPYLYDSYSSTVLDYGYTSLSEVFANQKAILNNMLVVTKGDSNNIYAVIDLEGNTILEAKYDNITYLPTTGDFKVEANGKVGILGSKGETKVQIMYDSIELMDSDAGLYVASNNGKYGVLDLKGNIKIYIENDEVGMDITPFSQNNIKNKYILAGNLIPVRKDKLWGLYDLTGKQVVDFTYDSFGYIAKSNKDTMNLLVIPDYEVLVACKNGKYTLLNSVGQELFAAPVADDIYMTISGGKAHYYITANNQTMDAETYLDNIGVKKQSEGGTVITNNNNTGTNSSNTQNNSTNTNTQNNTNQETNNQEQENNEEQQQENNEENNGGNNEGNMEEEQQNGEQVESQVEEQVEEPIEEPIEEVTEDQQY